MPHLSEKYAAIEHLLSNLPEDMGGDELIALFITIMHMYGVQDDWPEISVCITTVLADVSHHGINLN